MFIAALFTIVKTWKQSKCPLTDEWIKKMWDIYTVEYYSATKKNNLLPFAATWTELETLILSEMSERERQINTIGYHLYLESNIRHREPFHRKENHGLGE